MNLSCLTVLIQCQTFKIFRCIIRNQETLPTNHPIHIYINRINNRLVFRIKDEYKLELQTPETMKPFGSIKKVNRQNKEW